MDTISRQSVKFVLILLAGAFCITLPVMAQNTLPQTEIQDMESYQMGELNNQDNWSNAWNSPQIQDQVTYSDQKTISNVAGFGTASYKELGSLFSTVGMASVMLRVENNTLSDNQELFGLYKGVGEEFIALFKFANNFDDQQNTLLFSLAESAEVANVGTINQGQWHKLSLAWRSEDFTIRIKLDDNAWTPWFPSQTSWTSDGPLGLKIALPDSSLYGNFYLADIRSFPNETDPTPDLVVINAAEATSTSDVSADLLLLSITLSSTSISSNLENGLIVTASLDGIPGVATSSVLDTSTTSEAETDISTSTENGDGSSVGEFIMDIIDSVIDIFTPEDDPVPTEPNIVDSTPTETIDPEPAPSASEPVPDNTPTETPEAEPELPNEVQSSLSTAEDLDHEITTTEF